MKKLKIIFLLGWGMLTALSLQAQKKVPHSFQYAAEVAEEGTLKEITQVSYSGTSSIRLFFEEAQLGPNSYMLLEGSDGAQQKLDAKALQHWRNSSAYFNGQNVKVSLYQAAGEEVSLKLKELKVNEHASKQKANQTGLAANTNARVEDITEVNPWAAAVGRFTDGVETKGNGFIAANGAIVTHIEYSKRLSNEVEDDSWMDLGMDMIEFNVPPSNPDGTVNHPAPEDQYPINTNYLWWQLIAGKKNIGNSAIYDAISIREVSELTSYEHFVGGATIVEALPNGTGKRPGERIGEYFQVTRHPTGVNMDGQELQMYYHGKNSKNTDETKYYTLQSVNGFANNPNKWIFRVDDKDQFVVFDKINEYQQTYTWEGSPIVYRESNVAVGINTFGDVRTHEVGTGFRNWELLNGLSTFFSSDMTYVDQESYWLTDNEGTIYRPYLTIAEGVQKAANNDVLSIARGAYNESIIIDKPLKLSAPVGTVKIGASEGINARSLRPSLPSELFVEDYGDAFAEEEDLLVEQSSLKSFPNPFVDRTELHYTLRDTSPVQVKVFNLLGQEVHTLVEEEQTEGQYAVQWDGRNVQGQTMPKGLYIMQLKTGEETSAVRIMKQ